MRDELAELEASHPSPIPVAVLRPAVERLRGLETKIATLEAQLEGEVQVSFEVPPGAALAAPLAHGRHPRRGRVCSSPASASC